MKRWLPISMMGILLWSTQAFSHPGHHHFHDFETGLLHPILGLDHLIAIVVIGVLALRFEMPARLPLLFVGSMLAAMLIGLSFTMPGAALFSALSVVGLGLALCFESRIRPGHLVALIMAAGALHGQSHVAELLAGLSALTFVAGCLMTTAISLGLVVLSARVLERSRWNLHQLVGATGVIAGLGVAIYVAAMM